MSSFSSFTYKGSLYLQKKIFTSVLSKFGRFWRMRLMFLSTTYWISGSLWSSVTSGGESFFVRRLKISVFDSLSIVTAISNTAWEAS